jgi:hypothetical protein
MISPLTGVPYGVKQELPRFFVVPAKRPQIATQHEQNLAI